MRRTAKFLSVLALATLGAVGQVGPAWAQQTQSFYPTNKTSLAVTTASARTAFTSAGPTALVVNTGTVAAYVNFGANNITATTADTPINAGCSFAFNIQGRGYIAGITASGTTSLSIITGQGLATLSPSACGGANAGANVNITGLNGAAPSAGNPFPVTIVAGAGAGGTSSTFGAAAPATGTAVGLSDGTNMRQPRVFDADSGAGTQYVEGVQLRTTGNGGSTEIGVAGAPVRTDPTGTTPQPVTDNGGSLTVDGTITAKVQDNAGNGLTSATRGAQQALSVQIVDAAGAQVTSFGGAGGTASNFGSAVPSAGTAVGLSDGTNMQNPRVFDADSGGGTQYVQGVQLRGTGAGGSVEIGTAASPVRTDPTGTTPQPVSGTVTVGGTVAATQSGTWNVTNLSGTVSLPTGASTAANQASIIGTKAAGAAATNSELVGGVYNTSLPTLTNGQQSAAQFDASGRLIVNVGAGGGSGGTSSTFGAATPATGTAIGFSDGTNMVAGRVKAASTAPVATDPSVVVSISPNGVNANGPATMANSTPVVIASDQSALITQYAAPTNFVSGVTAAMTGTTTTSIMAAPAAGLRNYITHIACTNSHATVGTFVVVQDGSGGTTFYEGYAAAVGGGFSFTLPTPLRQPTTATAVVVANVTTGANVICVASGYKAA